jgi:hypothetical protein
MIIHRGEPSHIYPSINNAILKNIDIPHLQFHYVYELADQKDILNKNNIFKIMSKNFKHPRFEGFLYGIFQDAHCNFDFKKDIIFTFMFDPITKINNYYSWFEDYYNFYKSLDSLNDFFLKNKKREGNPSMPISEDFWDLNLLKLALNDEKRFFITYEKFIDKIINYEDFVFKYKDVEYKIPSELIYGGSNYENINFIGKKENLKEFKTFLSDTFRKEIDFKYSDLKYNFNILYRRKELENIMEKQMHLYYNI